MLKAEQVGTNEGREDLRGTEGSDIILTLNSSHAETRSGEKRFEVTIQKQPLRV